MSPGYKPGSDTKHPDYSRDALRSNPTLVTSAKEEQKQPSEVPGIVMTYCPLPTTAILRDYCSLGVSCPRTNRQSLEGVSGVTTSLSTETNEQQIGQVGLTAINPFNKDGEGDWAKIFHEAIHSSL